MFRKFTMPSPATALAFLALAIALGGTAFAATTTIVRITNNTGSHVANVDSFGRVATVTDPGIPQAPASGYYFFSTGSPLTMIKPSKATFALDTFTISNSFNNIVSMRVTLIQTSTTSSTDCVTGATSRNIGAYYVPPGQSFAVPFSSSLILKPEPGKFWCLVAIAALKGNPASYSNPEVSFNGRALAGAL